MAIPTPSTKISEPLCTLCTLCTEEINLLSKGGLKMNLAFLISFMTFHLYLNLAFHTNIFTIRIVIVMYFNFFFKKILIRLALYPYSNLFGSSQPAQTDYRLNRACCKPITGSIKLVASRLQTKTSRLQACCNIYFSPLSNCSRIKSAKKGSENEKCFKIPSFFLKPAQM